MANIGAEVGQKMRSAIKAKLLELNCYVDDELPDYVMVMVANKRTKSQMKDDLQLFLAAKTATFVDWLHIVLKKLKEVTVTNPEVYKKTTKRKCEEIPNVNVKKEKKDIKKFDKKIKAEDEESSSTNPDTSTFTSLTDDLPINANKLSKQRKIVVMHENESVNRVPPGMQDNFDIPLLSEVNMSTEEELEDIERKIKTVKSRLGLMVESDQEDDNDVATKIENVDKTNDRQSCRKIKIIENVPVEEPKRSERTRITFNSDELETTNKRKSILDRLGKRRSSQTKEEPSQSAKRSRLSPEVNRRDNKDKRARKRDTEKPKEGVLSRLGVMSKVSVPVKQPEEPEEPFKSREVPSMVKIKPRVIPHDAPQANKNLLLKAVAEAQRSIAQAPRVGQNLKVEGLFTKKYKEQQNTKTKKLTTIEKQNRLKEILANFSDNEHDDDTNEEYVPKKLTSQQNTQIMHIATGSNSETTDVPENNFIENGKLKQQFIVTLDGIEKNKFKIAIDDKKNEKVSIKSRLDKKKSPSPIIFETNQENLTSSTPKPKSTIPDKLPIVHAPSSIKNKERCKYWPGCRQGDKCEFVHPTTNCDKFPHCKFGEKCLYLHPSCKFGSSCTRRGCVYNHGTKATSTPLISTPNQSVQTCKFYPNCINASCAFYHPKPCKFGKYCKNQGECTFSHNFVPTKSSLIWRSK